MRSNRREGSPRPTATGKLRRPSVMKAGKKIDDPTRVPNEGTTYKDVTYGRSSRAAQDHFSKDFEDGPRTAQNGFQEDGEDDAVLHQDSSACRPRETARASASTMMPPRPIMHPVVQRSLPNERAGEGSEVTGQEEDSSLKALISRASHGAAWSAEDKEKLAVLQLLDCGWDMIQNIFPGRTMNTLQSQASKVCPLPLDLSATL